MRTAKIYQNYPQICEPYQLFGDWYVKVQTPTKIEEVRLYNDQEYMKMYPPEGIPPKLALGFDNGYITLIYGDDMASLSTWLKATHARFHKLFHWYYPSDVEVPSIIPAGTHVKQLDWDTVSVGNYLKSDYELQEILDNIFYGKTNGEYVGEIGERITKPLKVRDIIELNTRFGQANLHIFIDQDNNVYEWLTSSRALTPGDIKIITGTIKDHKVNHGEKRTIITRCNVSNYNGDWV